MLQVVVVIIAVTVTVTSWFKVLIENVAFKICEENHNGHLGNINRKVMKTLALSSLIIGIQFGQTISYVVKIDWRLEIKSDRKCFPLLHKNSHNNGVVNLTSH